jgi:uncharacterized membrane protein
MPKRPAILIGIIVLIYIAARLWRLTDSCLWFDEIFGIHAAEMPWAELVPFVAKDLIHPPLFYLLLKLWITLGGESLLWLRLFPFVFSVLALIPLWMLCRELKLRMATVIVAFGLFAVNGALIKYAQEVRMYSLLLFLSIVSIWLFSRFFFRGKSFWMLVLANVFLVYSHYFGWFVVVSEVLAILVAQRIKILQTLLMLGVAAAAFVPWIFALFRFAEPGSTVAENIGWMQRPGVRSVLDLAFDLVDPFYFQQSSVDPSANFIIAVPLIVVLAAAFIVFLVKFKDEENRDRILFVTILFATPLLLAFVLSWLLPVSIWGSRHLLIVFGPAVVLIAMVVAEGRSKKLVYGFTGAAAVLVIAAFVMFVRIERRDQIWCAWEQLGSELPITEPRTVYVFEDLVAYHLWFSNRRDPRMTIVKVDGVPGVREDKAYFLPRGFGAVKRASLEEVQGDRFWIMFRSRAWNAGNPPLDSFAGRGFSVRLAAAIKAGGETAFLAEVVRQKFINDEGESRLQ